MTDIKIMACLLTDRALMEQMARDAGIDMEHMPHPTDLYTLGNCERCNRSVWIGPRQMEAKRADTSIVTFCYICTIAYQRAENVELPVTQLGGGYKVEGRSRW